MLKNKVIALFSAVALMCSMVTVANAAESTTKTKIIQNPTFFAEFAQKNPSTGQCMYNIGVNYTFEGTDPITYAEVSEDDGWGGTVTSYSGVGFKSVSITIDAESASKVARINGATNTSVDNTWMTNTSTSSSLFKATKKTDAGYVFFTVITSEEVDISCTNVTLYLEDYGTVASQTPSASNDWTYSSDVAAVDRGDADFYAYTSAQTGDDDESVLVEVPELTGDLAKYNDGFLMQKIVKAGLTSVPTAKKIQVSSIDKPAETQVMERTLADALGLTGETTTVDISKLVVVVMVSEDKADDYAHGFDFSLVD